MAGSDFHDKPYDAGTLRKLKIFELYPRAWLPVFLSRERPPFSEVHLFDFFAGPGADLNNEPGSPLRLLSQLKDYHRDGLAGWDKVRIVVHFFDASKRKIDALKKRIAEGEWTVPGVEMDIRPLRFDDAFREHLPILSNRWFAKLLIIDQCGVNAVSDDVFRKLINFPTCDFIFFLSSSILNRFHGHEAIKIRIDRPADSYHVHRAACDHYRKLNSSSNVAYLAPFSIKKGSNIYGLLFGSSHPLGIHKLLEVAWAEDMIQGEADFDIERENVEPGELLLDLEEMKPKKIRSFELDLERALRSGRCRNEADLVRFCIEECMTCQKAEPVLKALKAQGVIECAFRVPNIRRINEPRPVTLVGKGS